MRRPIAMRYMAIPTAILFSGTVLFFWLDQRRHEEDLHARLFVVQEELATTQQDLIGYTKFTDYLTESKVALTAQMKFLAARVDRDYVQVEHIQRSTLGIKSDATVIVKYSVEYSFGFDLRPDRFTVEGDRNGITITLSKPQLVASPAVNILSHEIPSTSVFIDEQAAVIALQQRLFWVAKRRAFALQNDPAVVALCEKKLEEFLRGFLARQRFVGAIPAVRFVYR